MEIVSIKAREILDSRGFPTLEAEVELKDGTKALGQVPSGASIGSFEAFELRDNDRFRFFGKGVLKAIKNVEKIKNVLIGHDADDQEKIDRLLAELDGTENKAKLGANATCAVSMAVCRASARFRKIPLYEYFGKLTGNSVYKLPQPLFLVLEGGKHGNWSTDLQEYFVIPKKEAFPVFKERLRVGAEIFHALGEILKSKTYAVGVGLEGAYMPKEIKSNEEAFKLIIKATEKAGYGLGDQVVLGIDVASSQFYRDDKYVLKSEAGAVLSKDEWFGKVTDWVKKYPIWSLEDIFAEEDWESWVKFTQNAGDHLQIVGDDLLTTNVKRIQKAIDLRAVNSVLVKLNQIGTVSETLAAIKLAHKARLTTIISHRAGETNDDMIADLCVGCGSWQVKFGGPDRGERVAKYNRLLRIEEKLSE